MSSALRRGLRSMAFGLALGLGIMTGLSTTGAAQTQASQPLADGIYLYGQAPTAGVPGATYMVFEAQRGQIRGAFYQPSSSFDCFHGELTNQHLALTVLNSYDQSSHPYMLALEPQEAPVASRQPIVQPPQIDGFHRIDTTSSVDQQVLATCASVVTEL